MQIVARSFVPVALLSQRVAQAAHCINALRPCEHEPPFVELGVVFLRNAAQPEQHRVSKTGYYLLAVPACFLSEVSSWEADTLERWEHTP